MADWGAGFRQEIKTGLIMRRAHGFLAINRWKEYFCRLTFKAVSLANDALEKGIDTKKYFVVNEHLRVRHEPYRPEADKHARHNQFRVYNDKKYMILAASNKQEAEEWVRAIQYAIDTFMSRGRGGKATVAKDAQPPVPAATRQPAPHPHSAPNGGQAYQPQQSTNPYPDLAGLPSAPVGRPNNAPHAFQPPPSQPRSTHQPIQPMQPPPPAMQQHQFLPPQHHQHQHQQQPQQWQPAPPQSQRSQSLQPQWQVPPQQQRSMSMQQQWTPQQGQVSQAYPPGRQPQPQYAGQPVHQQQAAPAYGGPPPTHHAGSSGRGAVAELESLTAAASNPNAPITPEQYQAMQQRINQLTQELRRYKHQHEHDTNAVDKDSTRRHRRHDKGKKNTF